MTITGGGGGIMEAAQTGAGRDDSFGYGLIDAFLAVQAARSE